MRIDDAGMAHPTGGRRSTTALTALSLITLVSACGGTSGAAGGTTSPSTTTTTTTTTTRTTTTTAPPAVRLAEVVDARTVTLSGGGRVQLGGLAQPGECWAGAATDFLRQALSGRDLRVVGATVLLPDGTDLAVHVLGHGMARAEQTAGAALVAAQDTAKAAGVGLWGAPCSGADVAAPPPPAPVPVPPPAPAPAPVPPAPEPAPRPDPPANAAYYANCAAARAAGAAPLYAGQPGYRSALDRDGDGVACE
ncbi:endonuclease YncB(thermonuclease family) [Saccharothrix longispora]|uniref:Endonuclease YncB(Thermonuclease family) n=2 Tax=Saccharothrix longispora TaxID=33920 RepID=A0ABU1Q4A4_9PSEU|nr:endonuclease YncB(thermonuclease family) [Saccharothrix longispora]